MSLRNTAKTEVFLLIGLPAVLVRKIDKFNKIDFILKTNVFFNVDVKNNLSMSMLWIDFLFLDVDV